MTEVIHNRVREALKLDELTADAISNVKGFIISENYPNPKWTSIGVPWLADSTAFNMILPDVVLDITELDPGWQESLTEFKNIKSLYFYTPVEDLSFIQSFTSLEELYIYHSPCTNWGFLSKLANIQMLYARKCPNFDISVLDNIADLQSSHIGLTDKRLSCIYLAYCNITDLSVFRKFRYIKELDLSHNNIEDVSPLENTSVYYLTLRWNKIKDISMLPFDSYYMNLRHNEISVLPMQMAESYKLRRLFLDHNPITNFEILDGADFLITDF